MGGAVIRRAAVLGFYFLGMFCLGFLSLAVCPSCFIFMLPPAFSPLLLTYISSPPLFQRCTAVTLAFLREVVGGSMWAFFNAIATKPTQPNWLIADTREL